jgi:hypothetical protein
MNDDYVGIALLVAMCAPCLFINRHEIGTWIKERLRSLTGN